MKSVNLSPRESARVRRRSPWLFIVLFTLIGGLSLVVAPGVSWATFGTTPPPPAEPLTILVGPVQDISDNALTVAGIIVTTDGETRFDERVGPLEVGAWARVEGLGDGSGGLAAVRVKVLLPMPLVKLSGPLDTLEDAQLSIDGIPLNRTATTLIIGDPVAGEDRVAARAAIESTGELLALQVVKINPIPNDDDDDDDDVQTGKTKLTGKIIRMPGTDNPDETWIVSGIPVQVPATAEVLTHVGPMTPGAWVKITGHTENGVLVAERIKTTSTHRFHKLSGVLTGLTGLDVSVDGIEVELSDSASVRGNPQVGDRVWVKMRESLLVPDTFVAVLVQMRGRNGNPNPPPSQPGLVIRFTGEVQRLPEDGLYGTWRIADRDVIVPVGAFIDEHKGSLAEGAFVEVTALLGNDNSITAVLIVVTRSGQDGGGGGGGDDDHDGEWVEFTGTIRGLPGERHDNDRLLGDWDVDGTTVHVTRRTNIDRHDNDIAVGDQVRVAGWRQEDDSIRAARIKLVEDNSHPIRFAGVIMTLPDNPPLGTWMVDEREVLVTEATDLDDDDGAFTTGQRVKVYGNERADGVIEAKEIEALRAPEVGYVGRIVDFPADLIGEWSIGEKTVVTSAETDFEQDNGAFGEGVLVKVKGRLLANGSIQASKIETLPLPKIEHVGEIIDLPDSEDLTGMWQIGLLNFLVSPDTELDAGNGDFAEGLLVQAKGRMRADGVVIAEKIKTFYHDDDD